MLAGPHMQISQNIPHNVSKCQPWPNKFNMHWRKIFLKLFILLFNTHLTSHDHFVMIVSGIKSQTSISSYTMNTEHHHSGSHQMTDTSIVRPPCFGFTFSAWLTRFLRETFIESLLIIMINWCIDCFLCKSQGVYLTSNGFIGVILACMH